MERTRSRTSTGSDDQSAGNLFELFDRDNSGSIDIHELRDVFAFSSLDLNEYQVAQLLRLADFDKSGRIEAHEFEHLKRLIDTLVKQFQSKAVTIKNRINAEQLCFLVTHHHGYTIQEQVLQSLCRIFDPDESHDYRFSDYISCIAFLKSASIVFNMFDVEHTGKIELNFDQFVYAASCTK